MKFTLPGGTPLGKAGDPLWILPQSPYAGVPYVGVSAERLPAGSFTDPLSIRLTRVEGPGHLLVWQSTGLGGFDLKIDSRDGISLADRFTPSVGGHEHHNWGFTASGIYRVYFQASGACSGQSTNTESAETPFIFHIQPLRPFEIWQSTNWPCACQSDLILPGANPDGDAAANAIEYALDTDPNSVAGHGWPSASLVTTNGQTFGALSYTRAKGATDCEYEVWVADSPTATRWEILSLVHSLADEGAIERVTIRDHLPESVAPSRFYQLRVRLKWPAP
jgi:surface-anchored protein